MGAVGLFLVTGLAVGALYALGGVGLVILNRATGVLNFAYGAIGALGAMTAWQLLQWKLPEILAWIVCIGLGVAISLAYGLVIAPRLSEREPVVKAVATLGLAIALLGIMNLIWVVNPRKLTMVLDMVYINVFGLRVTGTRGLVLAVGLVSTLGMGLFLSRTRMGLMMRAVADNRQVASVLGTPIRKVETLAWAISGALAGFSGLMFADLVRLDPAVLTFMVIPIISTTIIGRLTSIPVTFVSGLCMGVVESMLTMVPLLAQVRVAAPFVIAIAGLMWMQRNRTLTFSGED